MKRFLFLVAFLLLSSSALAAGEDTWSSDQVWTPAPQSQWHWNALDTAREATFATFLALDMDYTVDNGYTCTEVNPLIGKCANKQRVMQYGVSTLVLHAAVARALPRQYREAWQYTWIGVEGSAIGLNISVGAKFRF